MANTDMFQIRTEEAPRLPAPISTTGVIGWMRQNLFSSIGNTVLTVIGILIAYSLIAPLIQFAFIDAVWSGDNREACLPQDGGHSGACWAYVEAYFPQFIYGRYPTEEIWRVNIVYFLFAVLLVPLAIPSAPFKKINAILFLVVFPIIAYFLLTGLVIGDAVILPIVETAVWGGLLVTLVIAVTGIVASLPLGIALALGRRSRMPIIKLVSVIFIEFWRGVPLITVLFMSSVMLPLFLPEGVTFDKLLRVLIGVTLFSAAYMAEVVRGGLQAIPKGQYEGAMALGLRFWPMMYLIILPQALKLVIPGIVNTFIGLFKDTTLVLIVGMFDLLGQIQSSFTDPTWSTPSTGHTGYLFAAVVFWTFCFGMSRYSIFMEKKLHTGHKR
ncbi:MAG: amino acid ABC transporter permease [Nitratireductor sp.]|jgi:general L-amino acid transport system permease protein|uniref:Amino acid ABC transporter permease n=1 Tax=Roseibium algicola TaxID=2857014 RepID=A0ABM6I8T4_9HYPH|nr:MULTISPECIES: amino acid ABC transporter permease [Stappiaceae]MEC9417670.1 amino acid ABC transporter permease [Pseudomonadota bacterium]AMN53611.1 amino acid ABC transporter permease [Labrenzia sp. CP4]AQQ06846.1 amino acid ABC transporter permease [Roseibium aggregatum]MBN8181066.1 amino acid ABC transporter permease [Roseibium aggregatum]MBO9458912.1 amino acid ABC transporter permease [Labrenzia sp. R5_0]